MRDAVLLSDYIAVLVLLDKVELVVVVNHISLGRRRRGDAIARGGCGWAGAGWGRGGGRPRVGRSFDTVRLAS
jgi:hypothetical protein